MGDHGHRTNQGNCDSSVAPKTNNKIHGFNKSIKLKYVKLGYHYLISNFLYIMLFPLLLFTITSTQFSANTRTSIANLWAQLEFNLLSVIFCSLFLVFLSTLYFMSCPRKIYLVDFACFKPEPNRRCTREEFVKLSGLTGIFSEENLMFQKKILERSALGQSTYFPEALMRTPPNPCMAEARKEAETVMFGAVDELLEKTGVKTKDIGILVVNCSLFDPTPSLSAMIVNHYKLRGNVLCYDLGGMGCSAGLISVDLAKQLLQLEIVLPKLILALVDSRECIMMMTIADLLLSTALSYRLLSPAALIDLLVSDALSLPHYRITYSRDPPPLVHPNSYALIVSMENITLNWYFGNNRSMLVSNCLFRMGGAAILLSNRSSDRHRSKYQLIHTVRTHKGADDHSFSCVFQEEDDTGEVGVALSKDLMAVAGEALKTNITTLGPLTLPMSEQLLFIATLVARKVLKMKKVKAYIPDFKLAFEHFCIHAGGRAVLDELEKNLELSEWHMEPSRMTLYRFGNTSSSSLWYELAYSEAKGRIRRGDRTWQIAFGSGFKCNSAVWKALRTIDSANEINNPWMEEINGFPVHVPKLTPILL
ncbi:hypothetical protein Syun_029472 [Stephania yunnanensis]|uniref:3-ketoacyl-CoA synthase n=1 Tax=Stephania yunnanensis TaxID=152371 RepID=A0AAP0E8N5_9MAGN